MRGRPEGRALVGRGDVLEWFPFCAGNVLVFCAFEPTAAYSFCGSWLKPAGKSCADRPLFGKACPACVRRLFESLPASVSALLPLEVLGALRES